MPGRGEDARLPHAAAQQLAVLACPRDKRRVPGDDRAHRRAQSLGQAAGDGIRVLRELAHVYAQRRSGVEYARAVQMYAKIMPFRRSVYVLHD